MSREELIKKMIRHRELVNEWCSKGMNNCSHEHREEMHKLDRELGPIDSKQVLFEKIAELEAEVERLKEYEFMYKGLEK